MPPHLFEGWVGGLRAGWAPLPQKGCEGQWLAHPGPVGSPAFHSGHGMTGALSRGNLGHRPPSQQPQEALRGHTMLPAPQACGDAITDALCARTGTAL